LVTIPPSRKSSLFSPPPPHTQFFLARFDFFVLCHFPAPFGFLISKLHFLTNSFKVDRRLVRSLSLTANLADFGPRGWNWLPNRVTPPDPLSPYYTVLPRLLKAPLFTRPFRMGGPPRHSLNLPLPSPYFLFSLELSTAHESLPTLFPALFLVSLTCCLVIFSTVLPFVCFRCPASSLPP